MTYKQHLLFNVLSMHLYGDYVEKHLSHRFTSPWKPARTILAVAVWTTRTLLFHRQTDSMFVFDNFSPFRELLHPIMDCLTWQATFTVHGQHFFVDILCCHVFCPQKPHNITLCYCGTRIQGRRHLVTAALLLQSCAYRSLRVTIKLDSAAI